MESASFRPPFPPSTRAWPTSSQDVHRKAREQRTEWSGGALQQGQETAEEEADLLAPRGLRQDLEALLQGGKPPSSVNVGFYML